MKRWTSTLTRAGLGLAVIAAAVVVPATGASAEGEIDGPWYVVNKANNRCLDAPAGGGGANGTNIQLWDCYPPSQTNQMWWRRWRTSSTFELINVASGTCLDVPAQSGGVEGTPVQLWECYPPNQTNQMWRMTIPTHGGWRIQSVDVRFNKVLDADAGGLADNGTKVQLWYTITGNTNQVWTLKQPNEFP